MMNIIGHKKIVDFLDKSVRTGNVVHAYLFSGPEHLGKFTVALDFAKRLSGGKNEKINPDIIVVSPEKDIKIERIRELQKELSFSPYFSKYKVAIIDGAERMTLGAQNALLKILEEPGEKCVLILVCHNSQNLLPTIKSRCLIKKFSLVKNEEILKLITQEKNKNEIAFWSHFRPGLAVEMQENEDVLQEKMKSYKELKNILESNISDKFLLAENLSKEKSSFQDKLNSWIAVLRKNMFGGQKFLNIDPLKNLSLIEYMGESLEIMNKTNSNLRAVLENLFLKF